MQLSLLGCAKDCPLEELKQRASDIFPSEDGPASTPRTPVITPVNPAAGGNGKKC